MTRCCWLGWSTDWLLLGLAGEEGFAWTSVLCWGSWDAAHTLNNTATLSQGPLHRKPRQWSHKTSLLSPASGCHKAALSPLDGACLAAAEPQVSALLCLSQDSVSLCLVIYIKLFLNNFLSKSWPGEAQQRLWFCVLGCMKEVQGEFSSA